VGGYRLDPAVKPRDDSTKNILCERSGAIFARARHLPAQSLSVYKIREGFALADYEDIVKSALLQVFDRKVLWARSGAIFARARHLPAQSLSVYKIREGFALADNEDIVKIAPLLAHKKKNPACAG